MARRPWFRATLISLLAVAAALVSLLVSPYLPVGLSTKIGAEAVDRILNIIASSMLAVTTFSLSTMVAAYSAATSNVTPRATKLLIEDSTTQNVLAVFVGSFLYSLVAIITLAMGAYGERGRVVLFAVTICIILLIVVTLLRWIDYLMQLGRVGATAEEVEQAAARAIKARKKRPNLGGMPLDDRSSIPAGAVPVFPTIIGYVQHIDMRALSRLTEADEAEIYLLASPGSFIDPGNPIAMVVASDRKTNAESVRDAYSVGAERSFDQDPRFGLHVMAEIASRALSSAVNDNGTVIDILGRAVRVIAIWAEESEEEHEPEFPRVHVPSLAVEDLFDDLFGPVARDGARLVDVQIRLQKAMATLARLGDDRYARSARAMSAEALKRAELAIDFAPDVDRIRAAAALVGK